MTQKNKNRKNEITEIGITKDSLTGRGGLAFILRYLKKINVIPLIGKVFAGVRKSKKGKDIETIISQLMCFFMDGSKFTMTRFDELAKDAGYQKTIEAGPDDASSSHVIKRFFAAANKTMFKELQKILLKIFIWRLKIENPKVIILGLDTMVLDNNDAKKRAGVSCTYKKVLGFHPLHIYWNGLIVNLAFHEGSQSPNHDNDLFQSLEQTVNEIRAHFKKEVPIIVVADAGFFDQKFFQLMDDLEVKFVCGGKIFDSIKIELMKRLPEEWKSFDKKNMVMEYLDFRDKRTTWKKDYRAIYTKQACENGEFHLEFDRPETIIYTNLEGTEALTKAGLERYSDASEIIKLYHMRAKDELVNRGIKDFVDETLPFKSFDSNGVYYILAVIAYNLIKTFQTDVLVSVIPAVSYPDTVRRIFIDIAGKIVKTSGKIMIKFCQEVIDGLNLFKVWDKCGTAFQIE